MAILPTNSVEREISAPKITAPNAMEQSKNASVLASRHGFWSLRRWLILNACDQSKLSHFRIVRLVALSGVSISLGTGFVSVRIDIGMAQSR